MKEISISFLCVLLVLPLFVSAETLEIAADPWCPYNCKPNSEKPGFMVEITRTIFEESGHQVQYRILNWARAKIALNRGDIDGIVGMAKSSTNVDKWVFPDKALGIEQMCIFTLQDSWKYKGLGSLQGQRLGVIHGYGYGDEINPYLDKYRESPAIITVTGRMPLELLIKMINADRIDALIENRFVLEHFLNAHYDNPALLRNAGCVAEPREVYVVFSTHNPKADEYAQLLGKGVKVLRRTGRLQVILDRYGVSDWKH